ncbi:hypothetical protein F511_39689 [Dorcoceras hygrometricum]|uniref:Dystroglycan-like n=1 Tax=Dorcoceras hygrometricum TaxID=472368 RepID=A0A2Z7D9Z1_9LAMI|nr:hypothetical protein F511_39689 [Dorcoceras hygrometricum]
MASSLFINTLHVCFESVLAMDNARMVAMFESLVATGLKGFLGCPAVIHEAALLEFFANGSVRDGLVVNTVNGVSVEISEQLLAETFELPMEGLTDLFEIPKDLVFDAKSIVSFSGKPVSISGKKKEMKIEFLILFDIMANTISLKAGSFDAITQEKFLMIAGITCGVKVNWNRILFNERYGDSGFKSGQGLCHSNQPVAGKCSKFGIGRILRVSFFESISGKKKEMKIEFHLLFDIMANTISVKAGSFDAITQEKFLMIAGITCGVKVNWNRILFNERYGDSGFKSGQGLCHSNQPVAGKCSKFGIGRILRVSFFESYHRKDRASVYCVE